VLQQEGGLMRQRQHAIPLLIETLESEAAVAGSQQARIAPE
jgi:hypothetical protein